MFLKFDISIGDFLDRMSIAEIKMNRIGANHLELDFNSRYAKTYDTFYADLTPKDKNEVLATYDALFKINNDLWEVEDSIRNSSDDAFISKLSSEIISLNDSRAFHKRKIDQYFGFGGDIKKYIGAVRNYTI